MRGIQWGPLALYWRKPIQVWWHDHKLLDLRVGF